jgi:hypothetical protein
LPTVFSAASSSLPKRLKIIPALPAIILPSFLLQLFGL